jgi:hypothetical protein
MDLFVSIDGDSIGSQVGRASLADDVAEVRRLSKLITDGNDLWTKWALGVGGQVVSAGGDEVVVQVDASRIGEVPTLRQQYHALVGASASVGLGMRLSEAQKALLVAKLEGKDRIVTYGPHVENTIQNLQLQQDEQEKLGHEYLARAEETPEAIQGTVDDPHMQQLMQHMEGGHGEEGAKEEKQPADFLKDFHAAADKQKADAEAHAQDAANDALKMKIAAILQQLKGNPQTLALLQQQNPEIAEAVNQMAQTMIAMGRTLWAAPQDPEEGEPAEVEGMSKGLQKADIFDPKTHPRDEQGRFIATDHNRNSTPPDETDTLEHGTRPTTPEEDLAHAKNTLRAIAKFKQDRPEQAAIAMANTVKRLEAEGLDSKAIQGLLAEAGLAKSEGPPSPKDELAFQLAVEGHRAGKAVHDLKDLHNSYKKNAHTPKAQLLRYLHHRMENMASYNSDPQHADQRFMAGLKHAAGLAASKHEIPNVAELASSLVKNSHLVDEAHQHYLQVQKALLPKSKMINGEPHVPLARYLDDKGVLGMKRVPDQALASYSHKLYPKGDSPIGKGMRPYISWVPTKSVRTSFDLLDPSHSVGFGRNSGAQTELLVTPHQSHPAGAADMAGRLLDVQLPQKLAAAEPDMVEKAESKPRGLRLAHIPGHIAKKLRGAKSPQEMSDLIGAHEGEIAGHIGRGEFLFCDDAAELLSDTLRHHRIPHEAVVGETPKGESHQWIRLHDGTDLDPTKQGIKPGSELEKAATEAGKTGRHNVILPDGSQKDTSPSGAREGGKRKVAHADGHSSWQAMRSGVVPSPTGRPTSAKHPGGLPKDKPEAQPEHYSDGDLPQQ